MKRWRLKANETKSIHVTFTTKRKICPQVKINNINVPQSDSTKYLGIHLDKKLTWRTHIFAKRKCLGIQTRKLFWLLNRKSSLSLNNKILLYKCVLKPVWNYGIQLWETNANSNIEILQRFQSKTLRMMINAPWYITNAQIHRELKIPMVKDEIKNNHKLS